MMSAARNSILCPNCRKLISLDEPACPYCGLIRPGLHAKAGKLRNILFAFEPVTAIIYINIAFFALSLLIDPRGIFTGGSPFGFLSPSNQSLLNLGASGTMPVLAYHNYWSLFSASFLHGGILHIVFNMMALYQLGPFVLREFGLHRFVNIYILTGVAGFAVSVLAGVPFTIGASASVCGLIGAIIYFGKSRGGSYGDAIFKQALGWVAGLIIFGFIFSGINNWAHGGGLLSGLLIAYLMGYNDRNRESAWSKILAYACAVITTGVLIWAVVSSLFDKFAS
ncbi:MAG: rhomboid family intramembrane serine protease [Deltaproteobacteria bacterium HGW-Deltaproteobacteria-6]|nr:MAG: rhomboid family intramembrane serine protease [Deltaproteobacteria bacterium HGW-Deltaproteobacteria-6]